MGDLRYETEVIATPQNNKVFRGTLCCFSINFIISGISINHLKVLQPLQPLQLFHLYTTVPRNGTAYSITGTLI